jgi:hypothetical protein
VSILIGGNLRDYNLKRATELEKVRIENEQLYQSKEKLETEKQKLIEDKKKLEKTNEKLEKDLQAKRERSQVRVASSVSAPVVQSAPADIRALVAKYFPANQVENALAVARCESGLRPNALNNNPATGDYSVGLFQINLFGSLANSRPSEAWLKNAENNISYAAKMYRGAGWGPWSCRKVL